MEFVTKDGFELDLNIENSIYSYYNELIKLWERELEINLDGLPNQYLLYREFFMSNVKYKNIINQHINEILEYTRKTYLKDKDSFEKLIEIANENMGNALEYYWDIINKRNRYMIEKKDEFDFRQKAITKMELINDIIENVLKKELYFIVGLNYINKEIDLKKLKTIKLGEMVDILLNQSNKYTDIFNTDIFKGVKINQFRNKQSHADIKNEYYVAAIHNKKFSLEELEQVFIEISKIRLFVKLHLNLSLEFYSAKIKKLDNSKSTNMKSKIIELNSYLLKRGITISSYKLQHGLELSNLKKYFKDDIFYTLKVDVKDENIVDAILLLPTLIYELLPLFNKKNNLPDAEIIKICIELNLSDNEEKILYMFDYKEVSRIQTDVYKYTNYFINFNIDIGLLSKLDINLKYKYLDMKIVDLIVINKTNDMLEDTNLNKNIKLFWGKEDTENLKKLL
ncbi:hypothetical protein [Intestinibacter bartlettii]|uniref:hypothetical protein n=1 Tax=Intestinibacter bartlettii TaxID=261299 RepID=UPI00248BA86F|nr:hypothetical protein [Intestinibacter bartlettii]